MRTVLLFLIALLPVPQFPPEPGFLPVPIFEDQPERPVVQLTYRFGTCNWPGYSVNQLRTQAKAAGDLWAKQANVRFKEAAPPPMGYSFLVVTKNKPGVWGTYSPGLLTISTWKPNLTEWNKMTPVQRDQFFISLFWHEFWHALGGHGNTVPANMIAWARARYGPPAVKSSEGDVWVPEPLPPVPSEPTGDWETREVPCGPLGNERPNGRFIKTIEVWVEAPAAQSELQPISPSGVSDGGMLVPSDCPAGACSPGHT